MIQDIAPHRLDNHYNPDRLPESGDFVISYQNRKMLVMIDEEKKRLDFPTVAEVQERKTLVYLFSVDGKGFFLDLQAGIHTKLPYTDMNQIRSLPLVPKEYVYAAFTAMHLAEWYLSKKFCGCCGRPLTHDKTERAMACESCGRKFYPRINPAVIVGVTNGDRLLITRYREGYRHNAMIAGFTEIGETLEETVMREVKEEAGLRVKNIRYYKSQPWGVAGDMLAGFFCDVDGDPSIHMDTDELRYAEWVSREEIVLQPSDYSLTNEMMRMFKECREI